VYICIDGEFLICWDDNSEKIAKGETVLLPAMIKEVILKPLNEAKFLEIYINSEYSL
jgi:mannose-6-phosphate isomerase